MEAVIRYTLWDGPSTCEEMVMMRMLYKSRRRERGGLAVYVYKKKNIVTAAHGQWQETLILIDLTTCLCGASSVSQSVFQDGQEQQTARILMIVM